MDQATQFPPPFIGSASHFACLIDQPEDAGIPDHSMYLLHYGVSVTDVQACNPELALLSELVEGALLHFQLPSTPFDPSHVPSLTRSGVSVNKNLPPNPAIPGAFQNKHLLPIPLLP